MVSERNPGSAPVEESLKNRPNNLQTVNEHQAAIITGFSVKGLQQRRWLGKPPTYLKVGRLVRYRVSDLMSYLDSCTVQARG